MVKLLMLRETVVYFYKRNETVINYILRFIAGLIILSIINSIGHYHPLVAPLFSGGMALPFLLVQALLFMLLPATLGNAIICLNVTLQLSRSVETAFLVLVSLILVLVFYSRLAPKKSHLIIAMILGFYFNMPYAVVLFAGLYMGLTSIIPITIGTYIWGLSPVISNIINTAPSFYPDEIDYIGMWYELMRVFVEMLNGFASSLDSLFAAFIYAMAVLAVYAVAKLTIDYAKEIAVLVGALLMFIGYIVGIIVSDIEFSIVQGVLFMLLSVLLIEALKFFDIVLNYKKAENVEFQDDDNYYYVRVIPKVILKKRIPGATSPITETKKAEPRGRERAVAASALRPRKAGDTLKYKRLADTDRIRSIVYLDDEDEDEITDLRKPERSDRGRE